IRDLRSFPTRRSSDLGAFALLVTPALAQFTVLDQAQDAARPVAAPVADPEPTMAPPPPCGSQALSIARMNWPSAELLAEIHARRSEEHTSELQSRENL